MRFADLNASGRTFAEEVRAFEEWLRGRPVAGPWDDVVVRLRPAGVERFVFAGEPFDSDRRWTPEQLEPHAAKVLRTATRGWVNLAVAALEDRTLVLTLEWFPGDDARRAPVSVNYGGFPRGLLA